MCCNLRGEKKKAQIPTALSAPADEALFSPPCLFQHLFEHFTTLATRNAAGLLELGGLFSKSGRSCAGKKHPGVLCKAGEGSLPAPRAGGQQWETVPASPGRVWGISLHLPAGSAWHPDETCWEAAHVMGGFVRGGLSWGPAASLRGGLVPPDFFRYPLRPWCWVGACSCSKVRAPYLAVLQEETLPSPALPGWLCHQLLVIYKHEGSAVARSSPNPPPPSSWGLSSAVRR